MSKPNGINPRLIILALICLLLASSLTGCVPQAPYEQMIAAMKKANNLEYQEYVCKASMSLQSDDPEAQQMIEILSEVSYEFNMKLDKKEHRYYLAFDLLYKGENCGNLDLYCDMEKITVQSVFLGPKTFVLTWNDLQRLIQVYFGLQIQVSDYLPLLFETDEKAWEQVETALYDFYADYFRDKVTAGNQRVKLSVIEDGQEKNLTCKELLLQMDSDDFSQEEASRLLQGIFGNATVRSLIKDKITEFITIAKNNGDLATWPLTEEELIAFRDIIDSKIDYVLDLMTTSALQNESSSLSSVYDLNGKIRIDQQGLWRNMVTDQTMKYTNAETGETFQYKMTIEQNLVNPGQVPAFPDLLPEKTINIGQTSALDWETLTEDITVNFLTQVMFNPLFQDLARLSTEATDSGN